MKATAYNEKYFAYLQAIDHALEGFLPQCEAAYHNVIEAMRYSVLGAGKRIRAILLLELCDICGGAQEQAMPFACAIEMIHAYSLVHDDLPCMDNDTLRRGKPSCWKAFGETNALLAGDGLLTKAFEVAACAPLPPERVVAAVAELAKSAGDAGMLGGQVIDLENEGKPVTSSRLLQMYAMKTGALLYAGAKMGCIVAGATAQKTALACEYAEKIGLAFQIVDDILDVAGEQELLGKPIGSDLQSQKTTYVTLHSIEEAQAAVVTLTREAKVILHELAPDDGFLEELTDRLATRRS